MDHSRDGGGERPPHDAPFWKELQATFETALDALQEIAEAHGIDAAAASPEDLEERERELDDAARLHPLSLSASRYTRHVNRWFRGAQGLIHEWGDEATQAADLDAVTPRLRSDVAAMHEAVEEIAVERHRIHIKVMRALRERLREGDGMEMGAGSDRRAAPAVEAFQGVQRSIDMWLRLREFFPDEEDAILNILVHLEHLRNAIRDTFQSDGLE